jgi:hypothetical protein
MYEDLEGIANLKYGQVAERAAQEYRRGMVSAQNELARRGHGLGSGSVIQAQAELGVVMGKEICSGVYTAWLELILQRNRGRITREDVDFILSKVRACADARTSNIASALRASPVAVAAQDAGISIVQAGMGSVVANIGRELEIKFREQEAFPPPPPPDVRFVAFLRAFGANWLTKMSGPLTVPFALAALFVTTQYLRVLFGLLAIVCGIVASYEVWKDARLSGQK